MKFIPNSVSRSFGRKVLVAKQNSPHIFFGLGLAGIITSTVLACKATLKLEKIVDEINEDLEGVKTLKTQIGLTTNGHIYTEKEYFKDVSYVYTRSALKLTKLYGPAVLVGGVSVAALTGSHVQLTRRNAALTMTLAAVSKAFEDYRARVAEEIGAERELEIHRAITEKQAEIDGKKQTVKITDPNGWSPYCRFFEESNPNWTKDPETNRVFIQCQQNYANHLLHARGHVFLNDVYDSLGMERSKAGSIVGWVVDGDGDGYIDFGLFEVTSQRFINNQERSILLDFNVDGVVFDKIKEY